MATTGNYGWTTPDDTAYVKDGASAIRTLGSAIDSTLKTQIDAQIPDSLLTTTGDVIYASGANTPARLGIGSTNQVLTVIGGVPTWQANQGSALTIASIASGSINSGTSLTISSITQDFLQLDIKGVTFATTNGSIRLQINGSSSAVYDYSGGAAGQDAGSPFQSKVNATNGTSFALGSTQFISNTANSYSVILTNCKSTGFTTITCTASYNQSSTGTCNSVVTGIFKTAAQVTSLTITNSAGTAFNGTGTYALYGG
jgi:hypothetical protein